MKTKSTWLCLVLIVFFNCSCQQINRKKSFNGQSIVINLDVPAEADIKASKIFKSVRPIILETKQECLIASVSDVLVFEDNIFLLDKTGKSLFAFNVEGEFVRRFGRTGLGPGEYSVIFDFTINPIDKEIYMLVDNNTIHVYAINGVYIRSVRILADNTTHFYSIQYYDGKIYATVQHPGEKDNLLKAIDPKSGKVLKGYFTPADRKGWNGLPLGSGFFNRAYGIPRYTTHFMNTVVSIDDMNPYIEFESNNFPTVRQIEDISREITPRQLNAMIQLNKIRGIKCYIENNEWILFLYEYGVRTVTALYMKNEDKIHIATPYFNDLVHGQGYPLLVNCSDGKGAYEAVRMEQFLRYRDLLHENFDKREQLFALNEESNPVIFYYEFKDE